MIITINLTEQEQAILENDLLDVNQWVQDAVIGKINNCKKRMMREWQPKLMADPDVLSIPATEEGLVNEIFNHKDYKNRTTREIEVNVAEGVPTIMEDNKVI